LVSQVQAQATPAAPSGTGKLVSVIASGSKRYSSEQIATLCGLTLGQMVTAKDFQAGADRLAQLGLFANVHFRFSSKGDDVSVQYQLEDAPALPVSFDNFPWFTDDELSKTLKDSGILFDGTAPEQGAILDTMVQVLTKTLESRGVHAVIEHTVIAAPDSDERIQQFQIVGSSLNVSAIEFSDAVAANDRNVHLHLSDIVGHPYSRFAVEVFDFEQVRPAYLAHGNLRVRFETPKARFAGDPTKPLPDSVTVLVPIEPGPVYKWGGAIWAGNRVLAAADLDSLVSLKAGDLADGMKIFAAWEHIRDSYGTRGFLDAKVAPRETFDDSAGRVTYHVAIEEGPQYRMGELVLTGLSLEGERRIRAAWKLGKGEVFNSAYYREFLTKGAKEAFGDLPAHNEEIGPYLRTDPTSGTVDVLLDFH